MKKVILLVHFCLTAFAFAKAPVSFDEMKKLAEQGDVEAQFYLGDCYIKGVGVKKDTKKGLKWYQKAAGENDTVLIKLANYYIDGNALPQDFVEGYAYLNLASTKNEKALAYRDSLCKQMSKEQIAEGQKRTKELYNLITPGYLEVIWNKYQVIIIASAILILTIFLTNQAVEQRDREKQSAELLKKLKKQV
jgi:hypothetical protein